MPELQFLKITKVFLDVFKSYKNYFVFIINSSTILN